MAMSNNIEAILKLEVPVIVQIAERTMEVGEVLDLAPGSIVELPKLSDDELELMANNKVVGTGLAVKVGENFGIRISYVGDVRARAEALAGGGGEGDNKNTQTYTAEDSNDQLADDAAIAEMAAQLLQNG